MKLLGMQSINSISVSRLFLADKTRHIVISAIDDCFSCILSTNVPCSFLFYGIIYAKAELERESEKGKGGRKVGSQHVVSKCYPKAVGHK